MKTNLDLMSDDLSDEAYGQAQRADALEWEKLCAFKYFLLIRAMLIGARGKPKQAILRARIEGFLKTQASTFPPKLAQARQEMLAELGEDGEEKGHKSAPRDSSPRDDQ